MIPDVVERARKYLSAFTEVPVAFEGILIADMLAEIEYLRSLAGAVSSAASLRNIKDEMKNPAAAGQTVATGLDA